MSAPAHYLTPALLVSALLPLLPAQGAEPSSGLAAKVPPRQRIDRTPRKGPERPVKITADTFLANPGDKQVFWKGNVLVVREDMQVRCDSLTADYDEQKKLKRLTCSGNVHMRQPAAPPRHEEREAWGALAVFDNDSARLTVTGSPHAREGENTMRGDKVFFDTSVDKLRVEGHVTTEVVRPPERPSPAEARK